METSTTNESRDSAIPLRCIGGLSRGSGASPGYHEANAPLSALQEEGKPHAAVASREGRCS